MMVNIGFGKHGHFKRNYARCTFGPDRAHTDEGACKEAILVRRCGFRRCARGKENGGGVHSRERAEEERASWERNSQWNE